MSSYNSNEFVPISSIVKQAALDTYADYETQQARYTAWAIRGLKKLVAETLRSGKRYAILNVNRKLNSAVLPCDFKEELFVGIINECGEKVALTPNQNIVDEKLIDEIPCENECDKNCGCYPKQMCQDLQTTQVINKITINDTEYDETITSTLQPNGEYYVVRTTPYLDTVDGGINYVTTKEYQTKFDVADCGCIEQTVRNMCKIENLCPDAYCCYCCKECNTINSDFGGYRIFKENNVIQFDRAMYFTKVYMEYRGFLPKYGNEYLVPEVAFETLVNFTKFKSVENRKGVAMNDRVWHWERYLTERGNMHKILGRMSLSGIIHSALLVPTFDYNANSCYVPCAGTTSNLPPSPKVFIDAPPPTPEEVPSVGTTSCNPAIITINGAEMEGGTTYYNASLAGIPFRVFANPFNRYLTTDEYEVIPTGGFRVLTGTYGVNDEFDIFPKWCEANLAEIPPIMGQRSLSIKVDGLAGSPVAGTNTYQNDVLIGADVQSIVVNKAIETLVDGDFTFAPATGTITRPANVWQPLDTAIIDYMK